MVKINEFEEHMKLQQPLLVKDVKNGTTSKGSPYLSLILQDNTGTIDGKYWDVKENEQALVQAGKILKFSFEVLLYKDKLQLRMNHVEEISEDEYNLEDFVISSDHSEVERRSLTQSLIDSIQNDVYRKLVIGMLSYVGDKFFTFPAASKIHHGWKGGLSDHSLSMATLADELCKHYPQLDRDLLVSAALIHDVEGKLEGHISLANAWLSEVSEKLGVQEREETVLMHHMILSHHGKMEYGSPVAPMIIEAEALYLIDNMDARLTSLKMALDAIKPGTWTSRMFQFENRQFYKHK